MDPEAVRLELLCDPAPTSAGLQGDVGDTPCQRSIQMPRPSPAPAPAPARLGPQGGAWDHVFVMIDRGVHDVLALLFDFLSRHYGGLTEAPSLHPDPPIPDGALAPRHTISRPGFCGPQLR